MRTKILIAAAVAAAAIGVWFFFFRRRVQAEVSGATALAGPPTPQSAIAQLQTALTGAVTQKITGVAYGALDTVGSANMMNVPQSTATPRKPCPAGFVGQNPTYPAEWCGGEVSADSKWGQVIAGVRNTVTNYAPSAGYYG